jgi:hypothetical protein
VAIDERNQLLTFCDGFIQNQSRAVAIRCLSRAIQIIIHASVTIVGENCFSYWRWISGITFANGGQFREISPFAFLFCSSLQSISIPAFVEVFDRKCFDSCCSLVAVVYEADSCLKEIRRAAFLGCQALICFFFSRDPFK